MLEITFQHSWQILLPRTNVFQLKIIAGNCLACALSGKVCVLAREPSQFSVFEAIQRTDFLFRWVDLLTKYKYILHRRTLFSVKTVSKSRVMFFVKWCSSMLGSGTLTACRHYCLQAYTTFKEGSVSHIVYLAVVKKWAVFGAKKWTPAVMLVSYRK